MDFDPTANLRKILGPVPKDPWAALIPQILLWSFRRFCIKIITTYHGSLYESIWDDHIELIQKYCPTGLEEAAIEWMTPENLQTMHSPLEDYNLYFTEFAKCLDLAIENDDFVTQDTYSEFLDTHILSVIDEWLGKNPFYIFPTETDMEDEFNSAQMRSLINSLITHVTSSQNRRDSVPQHMDSQKETQEETQKETQEETQKETQEEIQKESQEEPKQHITVESSPNEDSLRKPPELLWHYMSVPLMPLFMKATPFYATEIPVQNIVPVQQNVEPPKEKQTSISTVARAMAHRRTIRSKKRTEMVRVKTRRSHPTL